MKRPSALTTLFLGVLIGYAHKEIFKVAEEWIRTVSAPSLNWMMRQNSVEQLTEDLAVSGRQMSQKLSQTHPSQRNYQILNHLVGIEKWGQQRLKVALGEALIEEEYDRYRPSRGLSWNELQDEFDKTRTQTVAIANQLNKLPPNPSLTIPHNQFGDLTITGWLYYLRVHGSSEMVKMNA